VGGFLLGLGAQNPDEVDVGGHTAPSLTAMTA